MREILFRGKRSDNGEWGVGFLVKHPSTIQIGDSSAWYISVPLVDPDDNGGLHNVIPETVGQYTGLTDKNGKQIFEGDIVQGWDVIFTVVFDEYCRYMIVAGHGNYLLAQNHEDIEVIGNIHDSPELLKDGV